MNGLQPRRFVGRKAVTPNASDGAIVPSSSTAVPRFVRQQVPDDVLHDEALNAAIGVLPANYSFEIHKTVWRIKQMGARRVALQFPEGLLMYACVIADILESFAGAEHVFILGDVTYGACCVDDYSARALRADLLVHYGHSCLVPVDVTTIPCLYIFVDIKIDIQHFVDSVKLNFEPGMRLVMAGTIQFAASIQVAREQLAPHFPSLAIPQSRPLSPGEVLGCTAPVLKEDADAIVFVADGRFHLEAIMIANPAIPAYRYDPYGRVLTLERYDQAGMRAVRRRAVEAAKGAACFGLVLGTLGRQGNPRILNHLQSLLSRRGIPYTNVLLSEVAPWKLAMMEGVDAWVQIACPRLSIDWGEGFTKPTLTPYEALVALGEVPAWWEGVGAEGKRGEEAYPMDYYAKDGGVWNSSYHKAPARAKSTAPVVLQARS
ncbi:2-(3-amino-3-carboxypropyl)histidine synthase subunit 1 [Coccomyxa sp. Obi]|nr:2-(3-amino-3-carboxypropyl)histidine synthase subunit 1 [Coccomyxa sp. Obi]